MDSAWAQVLRAKLAEARGAATAQERGDLFALVIRAVFESIPGVPSTRGKILNFSGSQEIDIALWNSAHDAGLRFISENVILIECKNWDARVTSAEVAWFDTKLRQRHLKFGIVFAANGVTGDPVLRSAAQHIIAQALAEGRLIIVLTASELAALGRPEDLVELLKDKIFDLQTHQAGSS